MIKGYYFTHGNKGIFIRSDAQKKTDKIARAIIDAVAKNNPKIAPETIERAKTDRATLDDFKKRTDAATLEERTTANGYKYFNISGKNFTVSYPPEDFKNEITVVYA